MIIPLRSLASQDWLCECKTPFSQGEKGRKRLYPQKGCQKVVVSLYSEASQILASMMRRPSQSWLSFGQTTKSIVSPVWIQSRKKCSRCRSGASCAKAPRFKSHLHQLLLSAFVLLFSQSRLRGWCIPVPSKQACSCNADTAEHQAHK